MRRISLFIALLLLAASSFAGFKAKVVRPKRPAQFQARAALSGITVAADLLLSDSQQKDFFYKELNPSNIFAVRRESDRSFKKENATNSTDFTIVKSMELVAFIPGQPELVPAISSTSTIGLVIPFPVSVSETFSEVIPESGVVSPAQSAIRFAKFVVKSSPFAHVFTALTYALTVTLVIP